MSFANRFFRILLFTIICYFPLNAAVVKFEINSNQRYNEIQPIWDIVNLWSPSFLVDENGAPITWHRDTHPFLKRVILMTATGGRPDYPQNDILKLDSRGNRVYDFSNFDAQLSAALFNEYQPIIVLGAIPFVLAPENYHIGVFGSITDPPTSYDDWYDFVRTLVAHAVAQFGLEAVKTWQWRLYTEPDNQDWWSGTKEDYFKLYDYTAAAALAVVPDIILGPGNMLGEIEDHWGLDFIDHAAAGTNYYSGETGSYFKFFTISAYERCEKNHPPLKQFEDRLQVIKAKLAEYGLQDSIAIGFDEGQLLVDENGVRLWLGDGTEYGASWQAAYHILGIRENFERIVQWGFTSDGVKTPKYNVIEMLEMMKGDTRVEMQLTEDTRTLFGKFQQKLDGIASLSPDGKSVKALVYSHHKYRYPHPTLVEDPLPVEIKLNALPFSAEAVRLTHWVVDSSHSNYFNQWLADSRDLPRVPQNGQGGSIYDAGVNSNFNQEGHVFWWHHKSQYLEIDDLEKFAPDTTLATNPDGSVTVTLGMRPHQVSLLEIRPGSNSGVTGHGASLQGAPSVFDVFPNPFNQSVKIVLNQPVQVQSVRIFNFAGQEIVELNSPKGTAPQSLFWRGADARGTPVASGIYFVSVQLADRVVSRKVCLVR